MDSHPIRIIIANIPAVPEAGKGGEYLRRILVPVSQANAVWAKRSDTRLVFRFASEGSSHPAFAAFKYIPLLNPGAMAAIVSQAETEGFDAAILGCFGDPFLAGIRASASIPVIGYGESALRHAAGLGRQVGVVSPSIVLAEPIRRLLDGYGIVEAPVLVEVTDELAEHQEESLADAHHAITGFTAAARRLIARGADVLIPGCGLMSPALRMAPGLRERHPHGVTDVDGVPVVDVIGTAVLAAEAAVMAARVRFGAGYRVKAQLAPAGGAFWDCV